MEPIKWKQLKFEYSEITKTGAWWSAFLAVSSVLVTNRHPKCEQDELVNQLLRLSTEEIDITIERDSELCIHARCTMCNLHILHLLFPQ